MKPSALLLTASLAAMILAALVLYVVFKRKDWL